MAMHDERVEMEYLVGNFKPTNEPSDNVYDVLYDGLFGGNSPTSIKKREFLVAFAAAAKMINGNKKAAKKPRQENKRPTVQLQRRRKPTPKPRRLPLRMRQMNRLRAWL